jgi:hypothetical protein
MPEVKVNVDDKLDKKLRIYKETHDLKSKEKAILDILKKKLR